MRSDIHHAYTHEIIISKRPGKRDHNCYESDRLLAHSEYGSEEAEQKHNESDHNVPYSQLADKSEPFKTLDLGNELHDSLINSLSAVDNPECSSDDQHKGNDAGLLAESLIQRGKHLPGLRLATRHKPGSDSAYQQNREYDHICIRNSDLTHYEPHSEALPSMSDVCE